MGPHQTVNDGEEWIRDTGLSCASDGETIEYTDTVVALLVVKPYSVNGQIWFQDITTEDEDDYLYEPIFFHAQNWDDLDERARANYANRQTPEAAGAILVCAYCESGILPGETTGVATGGEVHRSQRDPDLTGYGNRFQNLDTSPTVICISCLKDLSEENDLWPDGVCHDEECAQGTDARCWREGCSGNCEEKEE